MSFVARNHHPQQTARHQVLSLFEEGGVNETELVDDRATTPEMFGFLHERFRFSIDVAASAHNAKLPRFFDKETNGLAQSWAGERVWCNPPYSDIHPWVAKAWESQAELVVMLLPANRTEQRWWQDLIEPHRDRPGSTLRTEFLRGRTRFIAPGAANIGPNERPPFGCVLVIWSSSTPESPALPTQR